MTPLTSGASGSTPAFGPEEDILNTHCDSSIVLIDSLLISGIASLVSIYR